MNAKLVAFLTDLADVLEKHNGGLGYRTSDDGVHATLDNGEIDAAIGWPKGGDTVDLRARIRREIGTFRHLCNRPQVGERLTRANGSNLYVQSSEVAAYVTEEIAKGALFYYEPAP